MERDIKTGTSIGLPVTRKFMFHDPSWEHRTMYSHAQSRRAVPDVDILTENRSFGIESRASESGTCQRYNGPMGLHDMISVDGALREL